ncbi:DUF1570 domain-containing protein [Rhodopirellula sp. P2]|nr:DUF1570 domain-containing protein [Rhodopirellula sp. P2]WDQ18824.1 DUF1570 domain-containing protein [Rhodopirellula sp. P2]
MPNTSAARSRRFRPLKSWLVWLVAGGCLASSSFSRTVQADYAIYQIPGTDAGLLLEGKTNYNPGGTVTFRHPRGSLYFNARDLKVIQTPTRQTIFQRKSGKILREKTVDNYIQLAQWALQHGMLKECKSLLSDAWKLDPTDVKIKKLASLMVHINRPVPNDSASEAHVRNLIGGSRMEMSRSKHFALFHDPQTEKDSVTKMTRAEMRLELLEKVYESYFLTFALRGFYLKPPSDPLNAVLFSQHKDFLLMERRLEMGLKQVAGFYLPDENISFFYDSGTSEVFRYLIEFSDELNDLKEQARRTRSPNAANIIRLANTVSLLVDIEHESEDVATVSHEAVHHLAANTGLFPRDGVFIRWVHEGLASYFESSKLAVWSGVGVVDESRISYYRALEGDTIRGSVEFIVSDLGFLVETALGDQLPAYGQAWALTHYLFTERFDELIQFYGKSRKIPADTPPKEKAMKLVELFGECFGDQVTLELEWRRYMRTLKTDMEQLSEEL